MEISQAEAQSDFSMDLRFVTQENLERYCSVLTVLGDDAPSVRKVLLELTSMTLAQDAQMYSNQLELMRGMHAQLVCRAH